jgi:hypothetical protein
MQPICKQRIGKHAYNNRGIVGNGVFYSVRAKWLSRRVQLRIGSPRVEAGSNTSSVTLRVVGSYEKGSLKSETAKYGRESQGTWTRK